MCVQKRLFISTLTQRHMQPCHEGGLASDVCGPPIQCDVDEPKADLAALKMSGSMSLNIETLRDYKKRGLIRCQVHPTLPLVIYNYTEKAQFTRTWDDITSACRGLITDIDGNIVARSFSKFHNIEEKRHTATPEFVVQDKLDGSLGILFYSHDEWRIASRGSFTSDQAMRARDILDRKYSTEYLDRTKSYVFEIIYPENRIVVDYGSREELVYLASFTPDGREYFEPELMQKSGFPIVAVYEGYEYDKIQQLNWDNSEGFVVKFSNGQRTKIKFENYKNLHAVVTNLSVNGVWNWFREGKTFDDVIEEIPDEWHAWINEVWEGFDKSKHDILSRVETKLRELEHITNRGMFAKAIKDDDYKSILFATRDDKPVHQMVCDRFKPKGNVKGPPVFQKPVKPQVVAQPPGRLLILCGISASGKTCFARQYVNDHNSAVIVSRDAIRLMLWGQNGRQYHLDQRRVSREVMVTKTQTMLIQKMLSNGQTVVVDDTNLSLRYINAFLKDFIDYDVDFKLFDVSVEEAVLRDSLRPRSVGEDVIHAQHAKLCILRKSFDFKPVVSKMMAPLCNVESRPGAYVIDVDGTLATKAATRGVYDWFKVDQDEVRPCVKDCVIALHQAGHKIIICSGRDGCCLDMTIQWLKDNQVPYDEVFLRPTGDVRSDYIVKEEMWRNICERYYIKALFDDRQQVVDHGRRLGVQVFQVQPGDF